MVALRFSAFDVSRCLTQSEGDEQSDERRLVEF